MTDAQITLYPERELTADEVAAMLNPGVDENGAQLDQPPPPAIKWGYRRVILVPDAPETLNDSGLAYASRDAALEAATAAHPGWSVG